MINRRTTTTFGHRRLGLSAFHGVGLAIVLLAAGCAGSKPAAGPAIPQPDGSLAIVPAACQVQTEAAGPYAVTFRFRNVGAIPLFRFLGCNTELEIASCASGYADQLASREFCPCDCATNICPTCGACYNDGLEVAPGATFDDSWAGGVAVTSTSAGRSCVTWKAVPPGRYRARLPLYASAAEAKAHAPTTKVVTADFELPAPTNDGVIEIEINP